MNHALGELRIGPLRLGFPVVQAALSGYSDMPMRVIARRHGAPYTLCEVMLDKFVVELKPRRKNRHFLHVADEEHPTGGQLMGADPQDFAPAALRLVESGFDVIDINFGCPVKKVLGRCRGGFHLGQPAVALEIVRRVRDAVPSEIPVTVKMRRGIDDSAESREKFFEIFDGAFALGAAAITVHGRTVVQRYDGPSQWEFLRELKAYAGDRVVLGSGDLFNAQACLDMLRYTGVDGVTVARGAIGNPWIFGQVRALAAGRPLPDPPSAARAARGDSRTLSAGGRVVRAGALPAGHAEVRDQVFAIASAVYGSACGFLRRAAAGRMAQRAGAVVRDRRAGRPSGGGSSKPTVGGGSRRVKHSLKRLMSPRE